MRVPRGRVSIARQLLGFNGRDAMGAELHARSIGREEVGNHLRHLSPGLSNRSAAG
jgi:hypothetical protein